MGFQGGLAMRRFTIAAMLLLCAFGLQAQTISGEPFIAVHGKAKAEVVPDIFPLEITLNVDFHAKLSRDFHPKLSHPVVG